MWHWVGKIQLDSFSLPAHLLISFSYLLLNFVSLLFTQIFSLIYTSLSLPLVKKIKEQNSDMSKDEKEFDFDTNYLDIS